MSDRDNSLVGDFIVKNAKTIVTFIVFICGLYVQYQMSMAKVNQLDMEVQQMKAQITEQYVKLDNMKLDKAVFEATMKQFTDMSTDIRQIRDRLEDMLGEQGGGKI